MTGRANGVATYRNTDVAFRSVVGGHRTSRLRNNIRGANETRGFFSRTL